MSPLILVVDDGPDVEERFRQQFRRDIHARRFAMKFAAIASMALQRIREAETASLILILIDRVPGCGVAGGWSPCSPAWAGVVGWPGPGG